MYIGDCFRVLGIEVTKQKLLIKKAYANKVKQCHPEDDPEQWKQLHDAYTNAIRYAEGKSLVYDDFSSLIMQAEQNAKPEESEEKSIKKEEAPKEPEEKNNKKEEVPKEPEEKNNKKEEVPKEPEEKNRKKEEAPEEPEEKNNKKEEAPEEPEEKNSIKEEASKETLEKEGEKGEILQPEYDEIFGELEESHEKRKEQLKESYEKNLSRILVCREKDTYSYLKKLLTDKDFVNYCQIDEFWDEFYNVLRKARMSPKSKSYVCETLSELKKDSISGLDYVQQTKLRDAIYICNNENEYVNVERKLKKANQKQIIQAVVIIFFAVYIFLAFLRCSINDKHEKILIENLNAKYGEGLYTEDDFKWEEVSKKEYKGNYKIYKAKLLEDPEKEVIYMSYKTKSGKTMVLQLDNFQKEEIEAALQKELVTALGTEKGIAYLSSSEPQYMSSRLDSTEPVYSAKYNGDLNDFFTQEKEERKEFISKDIYSFMGVLNQNNDCINGRCAFWFPDKEVEDITQRLDNSNSSYDETFGEAIKNIEKSYGIQVLAAAFPKSYYNSMDQVLSVDGYYERIKLQRTGYAEEKSVPLELPFVTTWYMSCENKLESITKQYEIPEDLLEATGQKEQYEERAKKQVLHFVAANKIKEGIYYINMKEDTNSVVDVNVAQQEDKIEINCNNIGNKDFAIVLDMNQLGISSENYHVVRDYAGSQIECNNYPYTSLHDVFDTVWEGEGYLYISFNNAYGDYNNVKFTIAK